MNFEPEAASPEQTAKACGLCRTMIYRAMSPDPAKRKGLPFLASFKVGAARRIRVSTRRKWLEDLERQQTAQDAA